MRDRCPRDLRRSRSRNASRLFWLSSGMPGLGPLRASPVHDCAARTSTWTAHSDPETGGKGGWVPWRRLRSSWQAACRSAASNHDLDQVPLDGVFAKGFELLSCWRSLTIDLEGICILGYKKKPNNVEDVAGSVPDQELDPVFPLVQEAEDMAAQGGPPIRLRIDAAKPSKPRRRSTGSAAT